MAERPWQEGRGRKAVAERPWQRGRGREAVAERPWQRPRLIFARMNGPNVN